MIRSLKSKALRNGLRLLRNQRGDTMITAVIAASMVGMAAAGTAGIVKLMKKESTFANTNAASLSVESTILLALQSPDTYTPDVARFMRGGGEDIVKGVEIRDDNGVIARIGGSVTLDGNGRACVPSSDKPCAMTTNVRIDCNMGASCRAAYQIAFAKPSMERKPSDQSQNSSLAPLGSAVWPPRPGTSDFSTVLSYDLFRREEGKNTCSPNELFVSGVDKSNGNVSCVLPSQSEIAKNQIGQTMEYNSVTRSLEVVPRTLQRVSCPKDYVLQGMDPSSLDEGRSPQGTCVYRYKKETPWMEQWPRGQASVSGPVCPQKDYKAVPSGSCKVNVISRTVGYGCRRPTNPVISYRIDQHVDSNGPNVSCTLVKTGTQPCGADWQGEVYWSGTCELKVPETVAAGSGDQDGGGNGSPVDTAGAEQPAASAESRQPASADGCANGSELRWKNDSNWTANDAFNPRAGDPPASAICPFQFQANPDNRFTEDNGTCSQEGQKCWYKNVYACKKVCR